MTVSIKRMTSRFIMQVLNQYLHVVSLTMDLLTNQIWNLLQISNEKRSKQFSVSGTRKSYGRLTRSIIFLEIFHNLSILSWP